jgi:sugar lactone lactonase YvrE
MEGRDRFEKEDRMTRVKSISRILSTLGLSILGVVLAACEPAAPAAAPPPPPPPPPVTTTTPSTPTPVAPPTAVEPVKPQIPKAIVVKDASLKTPESVLYDVDADVYLVSNINGKPTEADDNGTIVKIDADSKVVSATFIDGANPDVKLNAPKGMAIVGNTLYVADLDVVRVFDKNTGKAKGEIKAPKSTFLNDIAVGPAGKLFVSDSGLTLGKSGLEPNGSDAVYTVDPKAVSAKALRTNKDLLRPNGLLADDDGVWVVTFGGAELYHLNKKGEKAKITTLPKGGLDGIVKLSDGTLLVSSWDGKAVYRGRPGGAFEAILSDVTSPADIGLDTKRNCLLIPSFTTDTVIIQPLPELAPIAEPTAVPATTAPAANKTAVAPTTPTAPVAPTANQPAAAPTTPKTPATPAKEAPKTASPTASKK